MSENEALGLPNRHYLLIAVPKPRHRGGLEPEPMEAITSATMGQGKNLAFSTKAWRVPNELRVGTMDVLYTLLDDLNKNDTYIENVLRKIGRQRLDLTKKADRSLVKFMITQNRTLPSCFTTSFIPFRCA